MLNNRKHVSMHHNRDILVVIKVSESNESKYV